MQNSHIFVHPDHEDLNNIANFNDKKENDFDIDKNTVIVDKNTDIIDYSDAYILNSDFESGIFENSNWNSGNHFNFSSDVNITYNNYYPYK